VPETFAYKSVTLTCGSASFARRTLNYNLQKELLAAPQSHFPGTSLTSLTLLALDKPFDTKMSLPMTLRELIVDYSALRINLMVDLKHLVNLRNVEAYGCSMTFVSLPVGLNRFYLNSLNHPDSNNKGRWWSGTWNRCTDAHLFPTTLVELNLLDPWLFSEHNGRQASYKNIYPIIPLQLKTLHISNNSEEAPHCLVTNPKHDTFAELEQLTCDNVRCIWSVNVTFFTLIISNFATHVFPKLRVLQLPGNTKIERGLIVDFRYFHVLEELHFCAYVDDSLYFSDSDDNEDEKNEEDSFMRVGDILVPPSLRVLATNNQSFYAVRPLDHLTTIIITDKSMHATIHETALTPNFLKDLLCIEDAPSLLSDIAPNCTSFCVCLQDERLATFADWLDDCRPSPHSCEPPVKKTRKSKREKSMALKSRKRAAITNTNLKQQLQRTRQHTLVTQPTFLFRDHHWEMRFQCAGCDNNRSDTYYLEQSSFPGTQFTELSTKTCFYCLQNKRLLCSACATCHICKYFNHR